MPGSVRIGAGWLLGISFLLFARPSTPGLLLGAGIAALGLALRGWAAGCIDKDASLAVSGPYAHTRNPLYLGSFVIGMGMGVAGGHWTWPITFLVVFVAVYVPTIRQEAEALERNFGDPFRRYADAVPAFAVRALPYRPSEVAGEPFAEGFRWSRYLAHREWEAALGVAGALLVLVLKIRFGGA